MTIYLEEFIIENILINILLLRLIMLTTKHQSNFSNIFISALIGSVFSVFAGIYISNILILNILKTLCASIMLLICFKQNLKEFIFNFILLYIFTYSFAGAIISFASYNLQFGQIILSNKFNLSFITILLIFTTYFFELVVCNLKHKIKTTNYIYEITLTLNKNKISINAYMDSGNLLNYNGSPVIVIDLNYALKLLNISLPEFLIVDTYKINCGTINGNSNLKLFKIDSIEIKNHRKKQVFFNQYIGTNLKNNFKNNNYKALISPLYI